jgi:uncharacterized protein YbjT (DUF2867 family)
MKSGVRRLVLLSGRGEEEAERVDEAVRDSGAELTILRSTWFDVDHKVTYGDPGDQARNSAAMTRRRIG